MKNVTINQHLKSLIANSVKSQFNDLNFDIEHVFLEHPASETHGDYSTNVALQLAKQLNLKPREVAELIVKRLQQSGSSTTSDNITQMDQSTSGNDSIIAKIDIAGPGFINFWLKDSQLFKELVTINSDPENYGQGDLRRGEKIMVEYAHPNTHKEMHIGHMRTLITGESLARILEKTGAKVFRANYQGDIGPHVAKAIWGTEKILTEEKKTWEDAEKLSLKEKVHLLGQGYILANKEYEDNKAAIDELNIKLYQSDPSVLPVYKQTRKWSLDYYNDFYERFYTHFDRLYFESEVAEAGKKIVLDNVGKIFEESDGAIIFDGEKYGLHKRVFVTSKQTPTYEAKDMALGPIQFADFPFDLCVHVVANEQAGYFQVVIKALELYDPKFIGKEKHLSMGMVQLVGKKISSRTGVLITVDGLIDDVKQLLEEKLHTDGFTDEERAEVQEVATIGAVKYSVLKSSPLLNATFDLEKSVSLDGDSGPYLQYTYARAQSVLRKAGKEASNKLEASSLTDRERDILRYLYRYPEVVELASKQLASNLIATYLFELAQRFNSFYAETPIIRSDQEQFRLALTQATSAILKSGLNLLGIKVLERM